MYDDKYTDYSVLAGTPDLKSFVHTVSPEIPIKAIYIHENYRPPIENENDLAAINDICIIKLEHSFNITNDIQVVQMTKNRKELEIETHCHVSGWGLDISKGENPDNLQEVAVVIWPTERCRYKLGIYF